MNVVQNAEQSERGSNWGIAFLINVLKWIGPRFVKLLVVPVALYYFLSSPNLRKVSADYLTRLKLKREAGVMVNLPGGSLPWLTFRHILSFSKSMVDRVYVWLAGGKAIRYQIEGQELVDSVLRNKFHGALFLVSHLGNFDLAIALSEVALGNQFNIVMDTGRTRIYNQFRDKFFKSEQVRFLEPKDLTPTEVMRLVQRVANGEIVIMAADRVIHANDKNSVRVNFLGSQAAFPSTPYIMANLLEVPVYCLFSLQKHNRCLICFELFAQKIIVPRVRRQRAIHSYAQKFATRLERECVKFPLQWYNFYNFWATPESPTQVKHDGSS